MNNMKKLILWTAATMVWSIAPSLGEGPLGTAFTYQGQLKQAGTPLSGTADFQFTLWDAAGSGNPPVGGGQVGGVQAVNAQSVSAGLFTVTLNAGGAFGANAFNGNARWLQVAVRSPGGSGGSFATLAPRQPLTASPYALYALNGPGGVSGSGTTNSIPLWSDDTTLGNSAITQSANGVQLPNGVQLAAGAQGNHVAFGSPNGETGMTIEGVTGRADVRFDGATLRLLAGPTGGPPSNGIAINSTGVQMPNGVQLAAGAQGNHVAFGSPNGETGMTIEGVTGRADLRFDGTLKLVNGPGGVPPATNGIAIDTSGNVGMGTVSPKTRLTLSGGIPWTSYLWTASMNLQNASAIGWEANASGQRFAIGQSTGGLYFFRTYAAFGQTIPPPNYDMEITDNGDVAIKGAIDIGYEIVTAEDEVVCPPGKKALGGGCDIAGDAEIKESFPLNNGWHCGAGDQSGFVTVTAHAICARVK